MAMIQNRSRFEGGFNREPAGEERQAERQTPVAAPAPDVSSAPPEAPGSEPPPPDAGDESPDASFPVPPVPPPPSAGPIFSLAGGGGGGAASFARPGTGAAKPFRSQAFSTNRSTATGAAPQPARFGAGTAVVAGGTGTPFLPAGLEGTAEAAPGGDDELARIIALLRGVGGL